MKKVKSTTIKKIEQIEKANLTLSDSSDEIIENTEDPVVDTSSIKNNATTELNSVNQNRNIGSTLNNIMNMKSYATTVNNNSVNNTNIQTPKKVYKKKVITNGHSGQKFQNNINITNNNKDSFEAISFLSNVTTKNKKKSKEVKGTQKDKKYKPNKKILSKVVMNKSILSSKTAKSNKTNNSNRTNLTQYNQKSVKMIRDEDDSNSNIHNHSVMNINIEELKLFERFKRMKEIEQLMQLQEFDKMKNLLQLSSKANLMQNYYPQMESLQPVSFQSPLIPYANQIYPYQYSPQRYSSTVPQMFPNDSQKSIEKSQEKEPRSCKYCEEIYKYLIMNNMPIKMITCLYCHRPMNSITLEYYLKLYKSELGKKYKNNLKLAEEEEDKTFITEEKSEENSYDSSSSKTIKDDYAPMNQKQFEKKQRISQNYIPVISVRKRNNGIKIRNEEKGDLTDNVESKKEEKTTSILASTIKHRNVNTVLNYSNSENPTKNMSLAEAFKSRRSKIINNMEKRANSLKESRTAVISDNMEMRNIYKKLNKKNKSEFTEPSNNNISIVNNTLSQANNSFTKRGKSGPSPELMNRLINGQKVKMSQKEMKELNKRLYNKLVEVKAQKVDDNKKEELNKLSQMRQEFTKKLKEKVITEYKKKKK